MVERGALTDEPIEQARAYFNAGNFRRAREVGLQGLAESPDDADLLRLVGKSGVELNLDDASQYLRKVTAIRPEDPEAWHDLGDALVYEGKPDEATDAFRHAVQLRPDDASALIDLAHSAFAAHHVNDAISYLTQAVEREPGNLPALRSLVDMYRSGFRWREALGAAEQIVQWQPEDVLAWLDIAELSANLDQIDEAVKAYARLREIDDDPEHELYAYHGMIEAEIRRERWRRALDLAVEATRLDRFGRTTEILAYVVTQVFGPGERPAPTRAEVDEALLASRTEHRRLHAEAVVV